MPSGDQPDDMEALIVDLYKKYTSNNNSIILAVTAEAGNFATSESLKIAKQIDPDGRRTLVVATKLDLLDRGTNANDILISPAISAKLGIVGVVNRSQQDILDGKTIAEGIVDEAMFLEAKYPTLSSSNGTPYLAKKIKSILLDHIKRCLPDVEVSYSH